jgi:predicted membrane-bound spermidine synthase
VRLGSLFSVLFFLSPSLICMGMVSPIIIQLISDSDENPGKVAGTVYAISTVGGILTTFLFGFYLIPELGIKASSYITGLVLSLVALIYFIGVGKYKHLGLSAGLLIILMMTSYSPPAKPSNTKILYNSNGLLGQLTVIDIAAQQNGINMTFRGLFVDGARQANALVETLPWSIWDYVYKIVIISSIKPEGDKALVLGMGGGSLVDGLVTLNFDVDIVELDERIPRVAYKYFNYNKQKSTVIIDDARHYIKRSTKKYDLVIFDIVKGECQPSYVYTIEGFADLKKILNKDALVIINFQGTMEIPEYSTGARSIYKTLLASGFRVNYNEKKLEKLTGRDVIFIASEKEYDFKTLLANPRFYKYTPLRFPYETLIEGKKVNLSDVSLLTDDKPVLELLNKETILGWRKSVIPEKKKILDAGLPLF